MKRIINHKKWIGVGAVLLLVLATSLVWSLSRSAQNQDSQLADNDMPASEPSYDMVAWGEVKYTVAYDLSIDFPSTVMEVLVQEGDRVSRGEVLATLDLSEYQRAVEMLEQQLLINEAGQKTIIQETSPLAADIRQLQQDIGRKTNELRNGTNANLKILQDSLQLARREVENARRDVDSYRELYELGAVSQEVLKGYEELLYQREKAVSDVENNLKKLEQELQTELDQLELSLQAKQVQLSQFESANSANGEKLDGAIKVSQLDLTGMESRSAKEYLSGNQMIANVDHGIAQHIQVVNGTRLAAQNMPTTVLQLIDGDSLVISAEVDEEFVNKIHLGKSATIVPRFDSSLSLAGTVTQISNIALEKDGKRIVKVEVKPQDPEGLLKPGFTADVYFPVNPE